MPMHDYQCSVCSRRTEELFRAQDTVTDTIDCEYCGEEASKVISPHADMNRMWAGQAGTGGGVNGYFDRGLGCRVHSEFEADKIAESRGLVRESDYAKHFTEDFTEKRKAEVAEQDKVNQRYTDNVKKFGGDKVKAVTETFKAKDCLSGDTVTGY